MRNIIHFVIICGLMNTVSADSGLKYWTTSANENYEVKIDTENSYTGSRSALLYSLDVANPGKGYMFQTLRPCPIEDGVITVSVFLKTEDVNRAGLKISVFTSVDYVRYEHEDDETSGSTSWTLVEKNIDIQIDCEAVNVGVYLKGRGKVWVDNFKVEAVENTESLSKTSYRKEYLDPDKIVSPGFEGDL